MPGLYKLAVEEPFVFSVPPIDGENVINLHTQNTVNSLEIKGR
jgi:hypothetical protein